MCGITGIYSYKGVQVDESIIRRSTRSLAHRGPDDEGVFCEGGIALGHRRLSIIDLSKAGHQPMISDDNRYVITYNGEVYNFLDIRSQLEIAGCAFKSQSDTEVVLQAFIQFGESAFSLFNGMFAIAIYDRFEDVLVVARDRFGIKPLYYLNNENYFVFGSEIKSILATGFPNRKINLQALSEYMWYGNPLGTNTMFQGIDEVLPGHYLKISKNKFILKPYHHFNEIEHRKDTESEALMQVRERLDAAVKRHLISDVPVGIFLSGGIDSSAITAFASKYYDKGLQTFSVGFDFDKGVNELGKAAYVSKKFGTLHNELHVSAEHLVPVIEELVRSHDEPFADAANIPLFLLCREIKGQVNVILQGDGGDEIFGGYSRYRTIQDRMKWLPLSILSPVISSKSNSNRLLRLKRFLSAISMRDDAIRHALLMTIETLSSPPENIFSNNIRAKLQSQNPFNRYKEIYDALNGMNSIDKLFIADTQIVLPDTFLEKVDKSTMAHSIEIRVPFLDTELTDYVMSLPAELKVKNGEKKYLLKQSLRGIVPDSILDGPKTGFGVPYSFWLQKKLSSYLEERLNSSRVSHLFDQNHINKLIKKHKAGKGHSGFLLWKALQLAIWVDEYNMEI